MQPKIPSTQANHLLKNARKLLYSHRARAKADGAVLDYGVLNVQRLLETNSLCHYCRFPLPYNAQVDHRIPISRGGQHRFENLCVACADCNRVKGMLTDVEYLSLRKLLETFHPVAAADVKRRLLAGGKRYGRSREKAV